MDNSAFVPNTGHMNSPALVVFSQATGGLTDGLRLQRPFNTQFQMGDASKELHRPFTTTTFGLRNIEAYGGLPAHILNHLQPQFLHPGLTLGSSAFRPLSDLKAFPSPSAFAPPKCLKIETSGEHASGNHGFFSPSEERYLGPSPRMDSCSPASASMSPQPHVSLGSVKEESLDAQISEDGETHPQNADSDSPGIHEENRGFRSPLLASSFVSGAYTLSVPGMPPTAHSGSKTSLLFDNGLSGKRRKDPSSCPVCGMSISPGDLETHFMRELDRLYKLNGSGSINLRTRRNEPSRPPALPGDSGPEGRWETFQRIKTNRQGRLKLKIRKRKADDGCPVCMSHIHKDEICLRKGTSNDEDETVDVEGYSELEDWNEVRKRNSTSVSGKKRNFTSMALFLDHHFSTADRSSRMSVETETEDLIVDGDEPEESTFGPKQYSESDLSDKAEEKSKQKEGTQSQVATVNSSGDVEVKVESGGQQCDSNVSTSDAEPSSRLQMIEELRSRIRQLEAEVTTETATSTDIEEYKCLICLEHYKKPVISTVCWHVHCEECWLHTLGSKKVCPQCGMITSPSDLRRIFM
ncbi:E3 ubiquitin-protein ligase RNF220-like isoform X2 [Agrilus planipennis]|uniref:E3 ubiquitin-protein ligase RNF220-like isoform X2 n=1 Tax=Agrilus planipennis TaxID=224129 RepID=A0A1W4WNN1_AGRPL|nr:E3 ubiquitin-protein ligase RNF220-like isoform X2 [Agrilus planipennis]